MAFRPTSWLARPGLLRTLLSDARLAFRLVREPLVPMLVKALPLAALLYVISPLDVLPDVIPVVGQLDDLGIILIALKAFLKLSPAAAAAFHKEAIARGRKFSPMAPTDYVIDAEFRRG
jgi:uncharacterized membrane protein YkvA (DUF1232 family)